MQINNIWNKYYENAVKRDSGEFKSLYSALKNAVSQNPDYIAFEHGRAIFTYADLLREIDLAATKFTEIGIGTDDTVMICRSGLPATIISIYALSKIGASMSMVSEFVKRGRFVELSKRNHCTYVIMGPAQGDAVISVLEQTDIKALVLVRGRDYSCLKDKFSIVFHKAMIKDAARIPWDKCPGEVGIFEWNKLMVSSKSGNEETPESDKVSKAYFHHGTASGTRMSVETDEISINKEAQLAAYLFDGAKNHIEAKQFRILSVVEASFTYGFCFSIHAALISGNTLLLCASDKAHLPVREVLLYKPDILIGYPDRIMELKEARESFNDDLSFLKLIFSGGEVFSSVEIDKFKSFLRSHKSEAEICTLYGLTETLSVCAYNPINLDNPKSIGIPLPGVSMKICDSQTMGEKNVGEIGEIFISTPAVMNQYVDNEDATKYIVIGNKVGRKWIRTGDLGKFDENGMLYYVGSTKNVCNITGVMVYPHIIEEEICSVFGVEDAAAVVLKDEQDNPMVVAVVVPESQYMFDNTLLEALKEDIVSDYTMVFPEAMRPSRIEFRAYLPKTEYSKTDYDKLINDFISKTEG